MFQPKYTISNKLLMLMQEISKNIVLLNQKKLDRVVLFDMERSAREISTHASTSIEGNPLPLTDVKQLLKQAPAFIRDTQKEVLNYNQALIDLNQQIQTGANLSLDVILKIHTQVIQGLLPPFSTGKLRQAPVFVNDPKLGQTIFWPPDAQDVPNLLQDLFTFLEQNKYKVDPLILAAIFHKQFILIHPFMDGNGRTVRLATKLLLANLGINTFNLFSFERYYNQNVTKYFATVGEQGNFYELTVDFTQWLEYFAEGILDELLRIQNDIEIQASNTITHLTLHHQKILTYLQTHPTISDQIYATLTPRAKSTRAKDFSFLVDHNFLIRKGQGKATYYTLKP